MADLQEGRLLSFAPVALLLELGLTLLGQCASLPVSAGSTRLNPQAVEGSPGEEELVLAAMKYKCLSKSTPAWGSLLNQLTISSSC